MFVAIQVIKLQHNNIIYLSQQIIFYRIVSLLLHVARIQKWLKIIDFQKISCSYLHESWVFYP